MNTDPDPEMTVKDMQPCSVAVVVPTRNSERTIAACLQSIRAQTYPCTTIVVDNASDDGTVAIAQRWADTVCQAGPERSAQRNYGASLTDADVFGFIDSDMVLAPDVIEQAVAAIATGAGAVIVPEETVGEGFWAEVRALERSFYVGAQSIEAPRFYRRDVFQRAGGFDESLTGHEDTDLTIRLREITAVGRIEALIYHDEGRVRHPDSCRKQAYYPKGIRRYCSKRGTPALRGEISRPWLRHPASLLNTQGSALLALKAGDTLAVCCQLAQDEVTNKWLSHPSRSGEREDSLGGF